MRDFVGVRPFPILFNLPTVKRDALIFDRIAIRGCGLTEATDLLAELGSVGELQWLLEQGIVFEPEKADRDLWNQIMSRVKNDPVMEQIRQFRSSKVEASDIYKEKLKEKLKESLSQ